MQAVLWDVIKANAFTTEFIKKDSAKDDVEENLKAYWRELGRLFLMIRRKRNKKK